MRVKICGVNSPAALDAAVTHGADWIGFVFAPGSPRRVSAAEAAAMARALPEGGPALVGLFVEPEDRTIEAVLADVPLDILQIYAPAARAAEIRARAGRPVWLACPMAEAAGLPQDARGVDGFVIEARGTDPARPGGHGTRLDPRLLAGWRAPAPWLLAGGLDPGNVAAAAAAAGAEAVDVSSGVESAPGVKDTALIAAFMRAARGRHLN